MSALSEDSFLYHYLEGTFKEDTLHSLHHKHDAHKPIGAATTSGLLKKLAYSFAVVGLIFISILLALTMMEPISKSVAGYKPGSLVEDIARYELRNEVVELSGPWSLPPSKELDHAWDTLLAAKNFRVRPQEMAILKANTTNRVRMLNGDYLGGMQVYHSLHCLNEIRKKVHWDYYGAPKTEDEINAHKEHIDHCIDAIRQSVMCRASTAVLNAEWVNDPSQLYDKAMRSATKVKCVDWGSVDNWARKRALVPGTYRYQRGPFH